MANRIRTSIQTWFRILIVGLFVVHFVGCDSNAFPQSWAEFKAFNPFDPKSGAERAVLRHFGTHSKRHDGNMQFIGIFQAPVGEQADFWEIRNPKIATSLLKITEADRLNGIEGRATFNVSCSALRKRRLFPKESNEWSSWEDGRQILKGETVKRKEGWAVQLVQITSMGGSVQVAIEHPERYRKPEPDKKVIEAEHQGKEPESTLPREPAVQPIIPREVEEVDRIKLPKKLEAMVKPYAEAKLFDFHTHIFEGNYATVWQAVERTLKSRGDKVIASDQTAGTMMTDVSRHGILGFPTHDKFFIYMESLDSNHTRIEFVLFSLGPNNEGRTVPITNKEFVAKRAQKFLTLVDASLKP